jgi:hypothetical protein
MIKPSLPMCRGALLAMTTLIAFLSNSTNAADFGTTNVHALENFRFALEKTDRPVTVISFGDSMASSYLSIASPVLNRLAGQYGTAGYSLNNFRNTAMWQLENGAFYGDPDYYWFCGYPRVPAGGAVWWANQPNPTGELCDQAGIFYISHTNGGQFRLMLSTNGGPWGTVQTLNGYDTIPRGHFAKLTLPLNRYRLRVESDTGTNFIIGPSVLATQKLGIHNVFIGWPGIFLGQVTNVPPTIREPIFAALQADLLIWHMKEDGSLATSNRMEVCEAWWQATAPSCDVVYIGTPWISLDASPGSTWTPDQNTVVRNIAIRHGRAYVDLMQPTISYNWLATQGFISGGTHLTQSGSVHCANILWDDLGFFALGLDRRVSLQPIGEQVQLSYTISPKARYRLEASPDLHTWIPLWTNSVAAGTFTTNVAQGNGSRYYRLGLTPP